MNALKNNMFFKFYLLASFGSLLLCVTGCKKVCSNTCYVCGSSVNNAICSDDYPDMEAFNKQMDINASIGIKCNKIGSTRSYKVKSKGTQTALELTGYDCE